MTTTDSAQINSKVGIDGNKYTTSISNDKLTNEDFLKLMIQELKLQDPTSPMDSKRMLDTQMKMSTINTNQEMIKVIKSMESSFSQSALSNAASVIGKNIEDGNVEKNGINKAYTVRSVENVDGSVQVKAQQILYMENKILLSSNDKDAKEKVIEYDVSGHILDENGKKTDNKVALESPGKPLIKDGKLVILDKDNKEIAEHNYKLSGISSPVYSDKIATIPFSTITKIF